MVADAISFFLCSSSSLCAALFCCVFCFQLSEKGDVTCHAVTAVDHNIDGYLVSCCGYGASRVAYKVSFVFTHKREDKFCCCFLFFLFSLI